MAVVTSYGSRIMTGLTSSVPVVAPAGAGGGAMRVWSETVETGAADSTSSTYSMARLPSAARIFGSSRISHDALGATTTTIDIGVYNTGGRTDITDDDDCINSGIVASTAGAKDFLTDRSVWGKRLWEIAGLSADPKCMLDVKLVLRDAHLSSGAGTITVEIVYAND